MAAITHFPTNAKELRLTGWDQCDIILISGDAYVDHPSFGTAIIARMLESNGYKIGIIPQPNWQDDLRDFKKLGKPRLFFGVSAGNMDSMVNHYTAQKRLRSDDAYTPGDKAGYRPDYAVTIYTKILKSIFPETAVVIGGIEASLRRIVHYDYWSDKLKRSVLYDSGADFLVYGMSEKAICELAGKMSDNASGEELRTIPQTCFISSEKLNNKLFCDYVILDSFNECNNSGRTFARMFRVFEEESSKGQQNGFIQMQDDGKYLVINPPSPLPTTEELDAIYNLPYSYEPHPRYRNKGVIPAYEMIKNSVTIHRGCFGGCSFCALTVHQGRHIASRSVKSISDEVEKLCSKPWFRGHISDLGGPSANMYAMIPYNLKICAECKRPSCIFPSVCKNLNDNPQPLTKLYRAIMKIQGIKKISIGSGIRYDVNLNKKSTYISEHKEYIQQLFKNHISGYLKVAPEHSEDHVLKEMRKPAFSLFCDFKDLYDSFNRKNNKKQFVVPYIISGHPGCTMQDMKNLKIKLNRLKLNPEQVQDFMPTPMTLSSVIFFTGINPYNDTKVFSEKRLELKKEQKNVFFK